MKIIYFSLDYTPHDHRFLSALSGTEHKVYYVRLQRGPRQVEDRPVPASIEQVQWAGGREEFRWDSLPGLVLDFQRLVRRIQPDIVHAGPIQTCGLIATLAGARPRLIMSWGFDLMQDMDHNKWWNRATKYVLRRADFFTSDCEATRSKAIACGMDPQHTIVFPWGVDLETFKPGSTRVAPPFTILCNRSWEPRYGVDVLAKAFVAVARIRPDVNLLLLGGGSQGQVIRRILENGGAIEQVTFGGQVSNRDLPRYYQMAHLYVSPSHVDGSSVSLMEAMACGMPVLISDIPANREWVSDGVNGWLFPDGSSEALAAKISQALDDPRMMEKMGHAARTTAVERADWKKNFSRLIEAYEATVAGHKG
jgi:glycosyltransferase involved in cell wall biosynthesis